MLLLGFSSCSDEGAFTDTEVIETADTTILLNTVILRSNNIESELNGFYFSCLEAEGTNILNILAYGEDIEVIEQEAIFEESLFIQTWLTPNEITGPGVYLAEGSVLDPISTAEFERFFVITIEAFNEDFMSGSFKSVNLSGLDPFPNVEGFFSTASFSCDIIGTNEVADLTKSSNGMISLNRGTEEQLMISNGFCAEETTGLDFNASVFVVGGVHIIDSNRQLEISEGEIEYMIISDPSEEYIPDEVYPATFISNVSEVLDTPIDNFTLEEIRALGDPISIIYTRVSESFTTGTLLTESGEVLGNFNSPVYSCN